MRTDLIISALFGGALLLAPAAWAHEDGGKEGTMGGMMMGDEAQHGAMHGDAVSGSAKALHKHGMKMGKKKAKHSKEGKMDKHTHWVCPMHDGGEGDKPGKCPKCGMDMEEEEVKGDARPVKGMAAHEKHEHGHGAGAAAQHE